MEKTLKNIKTEKELFEVWKNHTDHFVADGIFDESAFTFKRILFIMRDAHIKDNSSSYDLREILKNPKGEGRTWNNVARWTRALLDGASYAEIENITPDVLSSQLKRIAAINLKKKAGGPQAERIEEFASKDSEFIKRQIEIINPDIIIACGTFSNIKRYVFKDNKRNTTKIPGTTYRRYDININSKSIPVVEFYHPQYSGRNKDLSEDMLKIRAELFG